jgi:acetolactate synthase small subunit
MLENRRTESAAGRRPAPRGHQPDPAPLYCFSVLAAAEPGVMPRVLEQFAKRNLVPARWYSRVVAGAGLEIDIQVATLSPEEGDTIAQCLRRLVDVEAVLTCRNTQFS